MTGGPKIYYFILLLCIIYLLLRLHARLLERRQRLQRARALTAPSQRRSRLPIRNENGTPSSADSERFSEPDVDLEQEREDRRALILTSLIVKVGRSCVLKSYILIDLILTYRVTAHRKQL